jgi:hypothetical protein
MDYPGEQGGLMQINVQRETGEYGIENLEQIFEDFPRYAKRALLSALSAEGYRLKQVTASAIRSGGPGGEKWPQLNPHTGILGKAKRGTVKNFRLSRKKGQQGKRIYKEYMTSTKRSPLLRLAQAVRYRVDKNDMYANIGFIDDDRKGYRLQQIISKAAQGYKTPLTPRMRRFAFSVGFPLKKDTTELIAQPRPLMRPIFEKESGNVVKNLSVRIANNITRYRHGLEKDWDSMFRDEKGNY